MAQDNQEYKYSEFNSAQLKMKRLDKILNEIIDLDNNLRAFNLEHQEYNYLLKFRKLENLYQEVESKLTATEKEAINKLRGAIGKFMIDNPVFVILRARVYPFKQQKILNQSVFNIIDKFLSIYESECRNLIDAHGMDTYYGDDDEGL